MKRQSSTCVGTAEDQDCLSEQACLVLWKRAGQQRMKQQDIICVALLKTKILCQDVLVLCRLWKRPQWRITR